MRTWPLVLCAAVVACGSSPPPAAAPAVAAPGPAAPAPSASAALDAPYDDPDEAADPATLTPIFTKDTKPSFPKATGSESACWRTISLSGDAWKDYDALVAKCGTPTGAVEYVKPARGKLHSVKDKRDTVYVKIAGGFCYRFFGVADGSIPDLDILIEKRTGALVGDDKTNGPVAIIDSDKAWCMSTDEDYQFRVEVDGTGQGKYVFGVWARPKEK